MKTLTIGLFGCGTVGSGVYGIIEKERERIAEQTGVRFQIARICVLDPLKERAVEVPPALLTTDGAALLDDPTIDVIVEVIGGEDDALGIISRALINGKKVVTANKLVVARHLPLLRRLEELHGGRLFYGASVCGSIPILKVIEETLPVDRIRHLRGVVNGSTNYILTRLAEGATREEALALAARNGFLEADPSADLSGADAAHKLSILAFHAFGRHVRPEQIPTVGITDITQAEIAAAIARGNTIKLVAEAIEADGEIALSVAPREVPQTDALASVADEINIVEIRCDGVGTQRFTGKGAGSIPTANAVLTDLLDLVVERRYRRHGSEHACISGTTSADYARPTESPRAIGAVAAPAHA